MRFARIAGVGGHLPARAVANDDLAAALDTSDEWIVARTGIRRRHIAADGELASDLALPAAQKALARAGIAPAELDLIVFATTTPDCVYPSTACVLQDKLGAGGCAAFDVQAVCSGFVYALTVADALIKARRAERALVVGGEVYSHILDWQDRATAVLFGDGAGAAVLCAGDAPGILSATLKADGAHRGKLQTPGHIRAGKLSAKPYTKMDGAAVFRFAVDAMAQAAQEVAADAGVGLDAVDWFVPHQANARIMEATARKLGIAAEKVVSTVGDHANTSAASIPLALASADIRPGDLVLMTAVGGGFTWGAALARW